MTLTIVVIQLFEYLQKKLCIVTSGIINDYCMLLVKNVYLKYAIIYPIKLYINEVLHKKQYCKK